MKAKCSKCLTVDEIHESRTEGENFYHFCKLCATVLKKDHRTMNLGWCFLADNFGDFPASEVEKNMINARIRRAKGESVWV
jgi:hypothetical protein